jgi:hypothetical protein
MMGRLLAPLVGALLPVTAMAAGPIASSNFVGTEDPLYENGAWAALTSLAPGGVRFMKDNGAFLDGLIVQNHAGARTTAIVPTDHYSEIVVGSVTSANLNGFTNVGPIVRVQPSGPSIDSHYLWWASSPNGVNNLYRIDANGTSYGATWLLSTSPVAAGDRLRLIARGLVLYGIKNGVRSFIYNTGPNTLKYSTGTAGMLAFASVGGSQRDATIASWSCDAAPASAGTWASSTFAGTEDPLDDGDRWYPLPNYSGFKKANGLAIGKDNGHNASGVWSITPSATQYSEVTLGTVATGGGGPIVRIDRNNAGQTGWLLFLNAGGPSSSGIYKMTPDGGFTGVRYFNPLIISGDKWRLAANGNTLEVFQNGVSQFTYTTDGSYPAGDVGIEAYTPAFTFTGWEGGTATAVTQPPTAPGNLTAFPASGHQIDLLWTAATASVGLTGYLVERCQGVACTAFTQIGSVPGTQTQYNDTGLATNTSYSYRVRATDAASKVGPYSNVTSATTLPF